MKLISGLVLAVALAFQAVPAKASVPVGTAVQLLYSSTNVGTSNWVSLVGTTARAIQGLLIYNSSAAAIKLGIAAAGSVANSETYQALIPASTAAVFVPLQVSQSQRVSVLSSSGTISSGELDVSFLYY